MKPKHHIITLAIIITTFAIVVLSTNYFVEKNKPQENFWGHLDQVGCIDSEGLVRTDYCLMQAFPERGNF